LFGQLAVGAGAIGGIGSELGISRGVPADPGQGELADDQRGVDVVLVLVLEAVGVAAAPVGVLVAVPRPRFRAAGRARLGCSLATDTR
jgi:hypothetical protein